MTRPLWRGALLLCAIGGVAAADCPPGQVAVGETCVTEAPAAPAPAPSSAAAESGPPGTYPVHFGTRQGYDFKIEVSARNPTGEVRCTPGCTLWLPSGEVEVTVSGEVDYRQRITIPSGPARAVVDREPSWLPSASWAAVGIGSGMVVTGLIVAGVGAAGACRQFPDGSRDCGGNIAYIGVGSVLAVLGAVLASVGLVAKLAHVAGRNHIDVHEDAAPAKTGRLRPRIIASATGPILAF